ncbi:MAG: (2Fe-2S) ferredoxin domain-containing protein [Methylococcaceae bacterium]|nr:(2Fe-2S) ferredoxin domain-containing protein [Methylococcaceae bacterium]
MSYYQHHLFVCTHQREAGETCCANHDAQGLLEYAKAQLKTLNLSGAGKCRINKSGCMDRCNKGPVIAVYPEGIWYRYKDKHDIDEIISEHLQAGRVVERLKV